METKLQKIKGKGTILPIEQALPVRCSYCVAMIFKENEVGQKLHFIDGYQACAKCRILHSKTGLTIEQDRDKFEADQKLKGEIEQQRANDVLAELAYRSQQETETAISK